MTSAVHNSFEKRRSFYVFPKNEALPVSQPNPGTGREDRLRRRSLSSSAAISSPPDTHHESPWLKLRSMRSKSVGELGALLGIRKWWDWGWAWILSRKPAFGSDLEMYEHEKTRTATLRPGGSYSWSPALVLCRIRSELRRLFRSGDRGGLPQTCNCK